jgi:uncharacterized membrane protein YhaH (DUF805 family)
VIGAYLSLFPIIIFSSIIVRIALLIVPGIIGSLIAAIFQILLLLIVGISYLASAVRRIHDSGKTGWFYLVPFYNFYLLVRKGDVGANRWGNPN